MDWKREKSQLLQGVLVVGIVVLVWFLGYHAACCSIEVNKREPDLVYSMSVNNDYHLVVVANCAVIEDKAKFAQKVVRMCQEDAFKTIKLSAGTGNYPSRLDIAVYLTGQDRENGRQVCRIQYETKEYQEYWDIVRDSERFHLYLDGEEIRCNWPLTNSLNEDNMSVECYW